MASRCLAIRRSLDCDLHKAEKKSIIRIFIFRNIIFTIRYLMHQGSHTISKLFVVLLLTGLMHAGCSSDQSAIVLPEQIDFNFHIRPILSNHCFTCHGPDESSRQAGLRLDTPEGATALLASGHRAIVPGKWKKSELVRRIERMEPELMMPPPESNNPLSERDQALLKKWIQQGAEWKDYWAFIPPDRTSYDPDLSIDHFIGQKLTEQGLEAAPEADRHSLVRRLYYQLTGLPPSPEQVREFLTDEAPDAYEKLADRLLASPHFGERWARHWMDLVRYAETKGHEFDYPVGSAWRYRDYLIRAFNRDVPYDQLIREHLAGDLLENPRFDPETGINQSVLATIFYSLGEGKHSPVDIRKEEADRIDNIIDVTTKTFQGLTLACARCHDHKFDPLPTADYYALYGIFESTRFTYYPNDQGLQRQARIDSIMAHKQAIRKLLATVIPTDERPKALPTSQQLTLQDKREDETIKVLADFRRGDLQGWTPNGAAFAGGNALGEPIFGPDGHKLRGFATGKASSKGLGTGIQGTLRSPTFIIDHDYLTVRTAGQRATIRLVIDNFQLIQAPIHGDITHEIDDPTWHQIEMSIGMWRGHKAYLELMNGRMWKDNQRHDYSIDPNAWLEVEYALLHDSAGISPLPAPVPEPKALTKPDLQAWRSGKVQPQVVSALNGRLEKVELHPLETELKQHQAAVRELKDRLYAFSGFAGVSEGDAVFSPIFIRGNHQEPSEEQQPHRYLTVFAEQYPVFPDQGSGRLELADAMADPNNPLTARVMVNRIWHHLFGRGIVETVDNFGLQGKIPSHPELLDHLALRFIENDWSIKRLIRDIVLSAAFRRSTQPSERSGQIDPQNIWLQHYPLRRLEAEAIRDGILAVSGSLDSTEYGPPVPVHLTPFMQGRGRPRESGPLDGAGRRSVYQAIRRNFLPPMMLTFDFPVPFSTFGRRNVSNVPAQSLNLMNDPFVREQAEYWAGRIQTLPHDFARRLEEVYLSAFARPPTPEECEKAAEFFAEQKDLYSSKTDQQSDQDTERMIWADFCQVLFNSKEFIFLS